MEITNHDHHSYHYCNHDKYKAEKPEFGYLFSIADLNGTAGMNLL